MEDTAESAVRVIVVDDDAFACRSLRQILRTETIDVVKTCLTIREGLEAIETDPPNVAIIDLYWLSDRVGGIKLIKDIKDVAPQVSCLLLTFVEDLRGIVILEAFNAGAKGFFRKGHVKANELIDAVHKLALGQTCIEDGIIDSLLHDVGLNSITQDEIADTLPKLAPREREILALLNQGLSMKQVAYGLGIKLNTVKDHVKKARNKFDGKMNSYQLALFAGLQGWLREESPKEG